ncbi:NAD-dependent epimerase/dehydratase family protein [Natrialbaceae archaeon A-CW2]
MTILVTGATGRAGSWMVERLARDGTDVVGVDLERPPRTREQVTFLEADLTDQGQAWELMHSYEPDAVVHFAAIPRVGLTPGTKTFTTNVESTYHVFDAAGQVGADVVWASSNCVYGSVFAEEPWLPPSFPIDERQPRRPEDPYGTSKLVGEELGAMAARKYEIAVTSIRPCWITFPVSQKTAHARETFDPRAADRTGNFWSYVDVRDVATMVQAALEQRSEGHEAYLAAAPNNYLDRPTADVIESVFGELPAECILEGDQSAFTTQKARADLGWKVQHTWEETELETVDGPLFVD